jgi:hypothetical protein
MTTINRAPFNALVDDDGSNTVGTPWEKARIAGVILDPVDVALAGADWIYFTPTLYAAAGAWSAAGAYGKYYVLQTAGTRAVHLQYSIENGTLSAATPTLSIALPAFARSWSGTEANPCQLFVAGANDLALVTIPPARSVLEIARTGGQSFPAGSGLYVRGQMTYEWL